MAPTRLFDSGSYWQPRESFPSQAILRKVLEAAGYTLTIKLRRPGIVNLFMHHELGYPCYDTCSDEELRKFIKARRIILKSPTTANHRTYVNALRAADAAPAFALFTRLPAELRMRVYELYMEEFAHLELRTPVEPPLTRASRLLRTESLSIFYSMSTFRINVTRSSFSRQCLEIVPRDKDYLKTLTGSKIGAMRAVSLDIDGYTLEYRAYSHAGFTRMCMIDLTAQIVLNTDGTRYSVSLRDRRTRRLGPRSLNEAGIKTALSSVVDAVVQRDGSSKLTLQDFEDMCAPSSGLIAAIEASSV